MTESFNANIIAQRLQREIDPEVIVAEAQAIGMTRTATSLVGTRMQWQKLDYELHRKPADPSFEDAGLDLL